MHCRELGRVLVEYEYGISMCNLWQSTIHDKYSFVNIMKHSKYSPPPAYLAQHDTQFVGVELVAQRSKVLSGLCELAVGIVCRRFHALHVCRRHSAQCGSIEITGVGLTNLQKKRRKSSRRLSNQMCSAQFSVINSRRDRIPFEMTCPCRQLSVGRFTRFLLPQQKSD